MELLRQVGGHGDGLVKVLAAFQQQQGGHHLGQACHAALLPGVLVQQHLAGDGVDQVNTFLCIGGVLTFKNARKLVETVEYAPLDRLVLETDCPYLSPVPNRGKRNSSLNLPYVVEEISRIKNVSVEQIIEITNRNAKQMYRLSL